MKKTKMLWICALFAVVSLFAAVGCAKNRKPFDGSIPEAVLCDFEQWAPDFQTLRVRNEFGSVDVNTTADYVKSGKQSAALTVVGVVLQPEPNGRKAVCGAYHRNRFGRARQPAEVRHVYAQ